jgi:hypothetical protein
MDGVPTKAFKILMTHDPSHWDQIIKHRDDIRVKFIRPLHMVFSGELKKQELL